MGTVEEAKQRLKSGVIELEKLHPYPRTVLYPLIVWYMKFYGLDQDEAIKQLRKDAQEMRDGF